VNNKALNKNQFCKGQKKDSYNKNMFDGEKMKRIITY